MSIQTWLTNWKTWWSSLSLTKRYFPLGLGLSYLSVLALCGVINTDHYFQVFPILVLYYLGPSCKPAFDFFVSFFIAAVVYDSQRYYADFIRGPIHVKEPYQFDLFFFGIQEAGKRITPSEWFQIHNHPILDLITGFFYIAFIPLFICFAAYYRFIASRTGTKKMPKERLRFLSDQVMWTFLWVNSLGYSTYYWFAASPPWYAQKYGFGPARIDIPASVAGCERFDNLLGIPVFQNWYSHSADVHGAIPSLHIAYPLLSALYAFQFGTARIAATAFYLIMCFSAVYLNHHYILDILWGSSYACFIFWATNQYYFWKEKRQNKLTA